MHLTIIKISLDRPKVNNKGVFQKEGERKEERKTVRVFVNSHVNYYRV